MNESDDEILKIALSTYCSLLIVSVIVSFIVIYCVSYNKKSKRENGIDLYYPYNRRDSFINGVVAGLIVCFTWLIIPLIILAIVSCIKRKSMTSLLGGKFEKISATSYMLSVEVKNEKRKEKYLSMKEIPNSNKPTDRDCESNDYRNLKSIGRNKISIENNI